MYEFEILNDNNVHCLLNVTFSYAKIVIVNSTSLKMDEDWSSKQRGKASGYGRLQHPLSESSTCTDNRLCEISEDMRHVTADFLAWVNRHGVPKV